MPDLVITITIPAAERADAIAAALSRVKEREPDDERSDEEVATHAIQAQVGRFLGAWHRKRQTRAMARGPGFGAPEPYRPEESEE